MTSGHTRFTRPGVATAVAVAVALLMTAPAAADAADDAGEVDEGACPVVAVAQGVSAMVSKSDDLLLAAPTGMAMPVAQACVDFGLSESSGFASHPYPGSTVVGLPPLLRGTAEVPVPDYPAYASSAYPSVEESTEEEQGYSLSSRSSQRSTEAQAVSGISGDGAGAGAMAASAVSEVDPEAGSSAATATSDTQPLTINDVLGLGRVRSMASATVNRDGSLERDSRLTIGRTTVADQVVEITPGGVRAAGESVELADLDPVEVLEAAGVRVRYLAEVKTSRGVLSSGIEVTAQQKDETSGAVFTARYTFGRAFAAAARVPESPADGEDELDLDREFDDLDHSAAPDEADGISAAPDVGSGAAEVGEAPEAAQVPDVAQAPEVQVAQQEEPRLAAKPLDMGLAGLYLVIALGAVAMFGSGTLLRLLGVKSRWTS